MRAQMLAAAGQLADAQLDDAKLDGGGPPVQMRVLLLPLSRAFAVTLSSIIVLFVRLGIVSSSRAMPSWTMPS